MALSGSQKNGIILSAVSFLLLLSLFVAYSITPSFLWLVLGLGVLLVILLLWGLALAATAPDSEEFAEFNFRRYLAALMGAHVLSEREIENAKQRETAVDPNDQGRLDRL